VGDDTRKRILQAAGPIFAAKGFEAATIREICTAADSNLASVNYHFGDKGSLFLETMNLAHTQRLQQVPTATWPDDAAPEQKLAAFIQATLLRMLATGDLGWETRLMMREMLHPTIACQPLVEDFIRPQFDLLMSILDELLPSNTPIYQRQQIAFSIIGQCLHYRVADEFVALLISEEERTCHYRIEQLVEHIIEFSLVALSGYSRQSTGSSGEEKASTAMHRNKTFS